MNDSKLQKRMCNPLMPKSLLRFNRALLAICFAISIPIPGTLGASIDFRTPPLEVSQAGLTDDTNTPSPNKSESKKQAEKRGDSQTPGRQPERISQPSPRETIAPPKQSPKSVPTPLVLDETSRIEDSDASPDPSDILSTVLWSILFIVHLAITIFLFLSVRRISNETEILKSRLGAKSGLSDKSFEIMREDVSNISKKVNIVEKDQIALSQKMKDLASNVQAIKGKINDARAGEQLERLQSIRGEAITTKSVESLLEANIKDVQFAKRDNLTGALVSCDQMGASFVIFPGNPEEPGTDRAIPRMTKFTSASSYHDFYARFFVCKNPEAGDVWVKEWCIIRKDGQVWTMVKPGELEIR